MFKIVISLYCLHNKCVTGFGNFVLIFKVHSILHEGVANVLNSATVIFPSLYYNVSTKHV